MSTVGGRGLRATTLMSKLHTIALRHHMLPRDTNQYGTVFGGVILSAIDQAGFIEARKHGLHRWVTVSIGPVVFKAPVHVGDVVSFQTHTISTGTTSVKVDVVVDAERFTSGDVVRVTEATLVMVAVNAAGHPIPFNSPPSVALPELDSVRTDRDNATRAKRSTRRAKFAAPRRGGKGR